jgi:hypothetical protein
MDDLCDKHVCASGREVQCSDQDQLKSMRIEDLMKLGISGPVDPLTKSDLFRRGFNSATVAVGNKNARNI